MYVKVLEYTIFLTLPIGIVALARRLLIDLWRYLETGVIPDGAVLLNPS